MGSIDGFLKIERELPPTRDPKERINDYKEVYKDFPSEKVSEQASRCMDCGVPFCHNGCPLGNQIPEFNDAVADGNWREAYELLIETNNFPEFTGRICPAPCEASCVLAINKPAVTIENIEKNIIEKAFSEGWVIAEPPVERSGKKIAIVGSGPAGLAAAAQLNKSGHTVTVYEKDDRIGGLLRYGIPDFKMEKTVLDRRLDILREEGIVFKANVNVGKDISAVELRNNFDAILLCTGAIVPRDLYIPGRNSDGIHFAMEYLTQSNKRVVGDPIDHIGSINAEGKHVVVIGGGDTGSDCVGTANRQRALSVTQFQYRNSPTGERPIGNPWPEWPLVMTVSSSHEEGCERQWATLTKEFIADENGKVTGLKIVELDWVNNREYVENTATERVIPCDLALIAIGYAHPLKDGLIDYLNVALDDKGNITTANWQTNVPGVFAAGDVHRGQSLVVWAISEGREAARAIDEYLVQHSGLEEKDSSALFTR
ncbi:MAG: glutamate synthase subunit beta [Cyclobacteriaceae bacterium]